jgi:hypothetical protein
MNTNELRIGNLVKDNNGIIILVDSISDDGINLETDDYGHSPQLYCTPYTEISPIELTMERLIKFNFSINKNDNRIYDDNNMYEGYSTGYYFNLTAGVFYFRELLIYSKKIKYVHEFQNMYFSLTGRDLPNIL